MRICHVIQTIDPDAGGPATVVVRLASAQASLGHEVSIVSTERPERSEVISKAIGIVPGLEAVQVERCVVDSPRQAFAYRPALERVEQLLPSADAVHMHGVWEPILLRTAQAARRHGVPYLIRPAGMLDPWSLKQSRWKKRLALAMGYRKMLNHAMAIHMLNADEARLAQPLGLRAPSVVIPNGVMLEEIQPLPEPGGFRQAHPELGDAPFLLFLSRLHYKKGLDILGQAFVEFARTNDRHHLVVAGKDEGSRSELVQQIETHNLTDRVHLVGPIYGREKLQALRDADGFVLPSRQEGFSLAITEALGCGLPVAITHECHFPEVAEVGAGIITAVDPSEFAEAMLRITSDETAASQMGEAGRQLVLDRFTWPSIARQCVEAYQQ